MKGNNPFIAVCLPLLMCLGVSSCALLLPFFPYYKLDTSHLSDNFIDQILKESAYEKGRVIEIAGYNIRSQIRAYLNDHYDQEGMLSGVETHLQSIGAQCDRHKTKSLHCVYLQYWNASLMKGKFSKRMLLDGRKYGCIEIESHATDRGGIRHSVIINTYYKKMPPICQRGIDSIDKGISILGPEFILLY